MRIIETPHERSIRKRRGFVHIVTIQAAAFQSLWEATHPSQSLAWKPERSQHIETLQFVNAYPQITVSDGICEVIDGCHRIAVAASRGESIQVAMPMGVNLPISLLC